MTTQDIAKDFLALYNAHDAEAIRDKYWADDIVSLEPMEGPMQRAEGKAALIAKADWWFGAHEIHSDQASGVYVHGDQFAVRFVMDVTMKESGQRHAMDEIGLFTLKDGKIVEERYFYTT